MAKKKKRSVIENTSGPRATSNPDVIDDEAMLAMMKARLAYAQMHGNPAAQRMVAPVDNYYQFPNGDNGSHYMSSMDNYAVPQIQNENGQLQLGNYGPRSNEAIRFDNNRDAEYFAADNYKKISPAFQQKKYGGTLAPNNPTWNYSSNPPVSNSFQNGGNPEEKYQEIPEAFVSANKAKQSKYKNLLDKVRGLASTVEGRIVDKENKYEDFSFKTMAQFVADVKSYKKDATDYQKAKRLLKEKKMDATGFYKRYEDNDWARFDSENVKEKYNGEWKLRDELQTKEKEKNMWLTDAVLELTGAPALNRIWNDPIGTTKGVGNTLADLAVTTTPMGWAYDKFANNTPDVNPITGNPYWSGVDKTLDVAGMIPFAASAKNAKLLKNSSRLKSMPAGFRNVLQGNAKFKSLFKKGDLSRFTDKGGIKALEERIANGTADLTDGGWYASLQENKEALNYARQYGDDVLGDIIPGSKAANSNYRLDNLAKKLKDPKLDPTEKLRIEEALSRTIPSKTDVASNPAFKKYYDNQSSAMRTKMDEAIANPEGYWNTDLYKSDKLLQDALGNKGFYNPNEYLLPRTNANTFKPTSMQQVRNIAAPFVPSSLVAKEANAFQRLKNPLIRSAHSNEEELKYGGDISQMGYRDDSSYRNEPFIDIDTQGKGLIDMSNTGIDIDANGVKLKAYSGVTKVPVNKDGIVRETPINNTEIPLTDNDMKKKKANKRSKFTYAQFMKTPAGNKFKDGGYLNYGENNIHQNSDPDGLQIDRSATTPSYIGGMPNVDTEGIIASSYRQGVKPAFTQNEYMNPMTKKMQSYADMPIGYQNTINQNYDYTRGVGAGGESVFVKNPGLHGSLTNLTNPDKTVGAGVSKYNPVTQKNETWRKTGQGITKKTGWPLMNGYGDNAYSNAYGGNIHQNSQGNGLQTIDLEEVRATAPKPGTMIPNPNYDQQNKIRQEWQTGYRNDEIFNKKLNAEELKAYNANISKRGAPYIGFDATEVWIDPNNPGQSYPYYGNPNRMIPAPTVNVPTPPVPTTPHMLDANTGAILDPNQYPPGEGQIGNRQYSQYVDQANAKRYYSPEGTTKREQAAASLAARKAQLEGMTQEEINISRKENNGQVPFPNQNRYGGKKYVNGGRMENGGLIPGNPGSVPTTEFNAGGSHDKSPLGGIPQGMNPNGKPNLVEEGELKIIDPRDDESFIISPKIRLTKDAVKEYGLDKRYIGKDMVKVFNSLLRRDSRRTGDSIEEHSKELEIGPYIDAHKELSEKKNAEEDAKKQVAFDTEMAKMQEAFPERMEQLLASQQQEQAPQEQGQPSEEEMMMMQQQQQQEQQMQQQMQQGAPQGGMPQQGGQPSPEEMAMMQQQGGQGQPPMMAYGGNINKYNSQFKYGAGMNIASNVLNTAGNIVGNIPGVGTAIGASLGALGGAAGYYGDKAAASDDGKLSFNDTDFGQLALDTGKGAAKGGLGSTGSLIANAAGAGIDNFTDSKTDKANVERTKILNDPSHPEYNETIKREEDKSNSNKGVNAINTATSLAGNIIGAKVDNAYDTEVLEKKANGGNMYQNGDYLNNPYLQDNGFNSELWKSRSYERDHSLSEFDNTDGASTKKDEKKENTQKTYSSEQTLGNQLGQLAPMATNLAMGLFGKEDKLELDRATKVNFDKLNNRDEIARIGMAGNRASKGLEGNANASNYLTGKQALFNSEASAIAGSYDRINKQNTAIENQEKLTNMRLELQNLQQGNTEKQYSKAAKAAKSAQLMRGIDQLAEYNRAQQEDEIALQYANMGVPDYRFEYSTPYERYLENRKNKKAKKAKKK